MAMARSSTRSILETNAMTPDSALLTAERLRVYHLAASQAAPSFAEDVGRGLTASPKYLLPKYFYDALGSKLFEAICELPEYYLTRAEAEIFRDCADEIGAAIGGPVRLVELGSGDGRKTRLLIEALLARQDGLEYLPIDISASAIEQSSEMLLFAHPELRITAWVAEYQEGLRALAREPPWAGRTLVLFLGSTIGNLDPTERTGLLRQVRATLRPGDALLLGVDLKKPEEVLIPAYDDSLGVTAAFNLNLLARINRELGGGFDLAGFRHRAVWNEEQGRIEMHLESLRAQTVPVRDLDLEVRFEAGETIHTESSYKLDLEQVRTLASAAGFELRRTWTDREERFGSCLLVAR
jgi:dimethylhistidine N-methyltransferase